MRNASLALLVGLLLALSGSAEADFLDGLEAYWSFDTDFSDSSLNGRDATVRDSDPAIVSTAGDWILGGGALSLDGGDSLQVAGWKGIGAITPRTMAGWIRTTDQTGAILAWGQNQGGRKWVFRTQNTNGTNGAIRVEVNGGYRVSQDAVTDGAWHHVAAVLPAPANNVNQVQFYIDGAPQGNSATRGRSINTSTSGIDVRIGSDHNPRRLDGELDELGIWSRALDAGEISALYNGGAGRDIFAKPELIWDGAGPGNWGDSRWIGSPPAFPDETTNATIDTPNTVTVAAPARSVFDLTISNSGEVAIGAANTLNVARSLNAAGGSVSLGAGALLTTGGASTVGTLATSGDAAIENGGSMDVANYTDGGVAGTLTKLGAGTLSLRNVSAIAGSAFQVDAGTLAAAGTNPLGAAEALTLNGGTVTVSPGIDAIGVNFRRASNGVRLMDAADFAGFAPQANWNNGPAANSGTEADVVGPIPGLLVDSWGSATATTLAFSANTSWSTNYPANSGNEKLLTGYSDTTNNNTPGTYSFTNIPWSTYDVLVYVGSDGGNRHGAISVDAGANEIFFSTFGNGNPFATTGFVEAVATTSGGSSRANYVWLKDLSGDLTVQNDRKGSNCGVHGIQIVDSASSLGVDMSGVDVAVTANSTLDAQSAFPVPFGNLTLSPDVTLTTTGSDMSFNSLAVQGAATIANDNRVDAGTYDDGGAPTLVIKRGSGTLELDNAPAGNVSAGDTTFQIDSGTLRSRGADPLGGSMGVVLGGGTLEVVFTGGPQAPAAGLRAHWAFDEIAGRSARNAVTPGTNDGILRGFPADDSQWVPGKFGGALHFDGNNDWVDAGSRDLTGSYTVAMWARADSLTQQSQWDSVFSSAGGGGGGGGFQIDVGSVTNGVYQFRGDTTVDMGPVATDWVHLGVTYDGTTLSTYYNGVPANSAATSGKDFFNYLIGRNRNISQWFASTLDEIYVYDRPLTPAEMAALFAATSHTGDLVMTDTDFTVTADSTLNAITGGSSRFGSLTMEAGTLTTAGSPGGVFFTDTTVAPGATAVGFHTVADTSTGPLDGGSNTTTITKAGPADLIVNGPATNLQSAALDVLRGRVVLSSDTAVGNLRLNGGTVDTGGNNMIISQTMESGRATYTARAGTFGVRGSDLAARPTIVLSGGETFMSSGESPVAYWSFDNAADPGHDDTGNGHDGTVNGATWGSGGRFGGALSFDATNDYVSINGYKGITGTDPRSMAAWIQTFNDANHSIISWGTNSGGQKWNFRVQNSNGTAGAIRVEVNGGYIVSDLSIADGLWHHVVATWENDGSPNVNDVNLYIDGVLRTTSAVQGRSINTASGRDVYMGRDHSNRYFDGMMDEVYLFARALDLADIQALYTTGILTTNLNLPDTDVLVETDSILALDADGQVTLGDLSVNFDATLTLEMLDVTETSYVSFDSLDILDTFNEREPGQVYTLLELINGQGVFNQWMFDQGAFLNGMPLVWDIGGGVLDFGDGSVVQFQAYIPEPATLTLLGLGALAALRRRRRKR